VRAVASTREYIKNGNAKEVHSYEHTWASKLWRQGWLGSDNASLNPAALDGFEVGAVRSLTKDLVIGEEIVLQPEVCFHLIGRQILASSIHL
jgi:hypothetical protein